MWTAHLQQAAGELGVRTLTTMPLSKAMVRLCSIASMRPTQAPPTTKCPGAKGCTCAQSAQWLSMCAGSMAPLVLHQLEAEWILLRKVFRVCSTICSGLGPSNMSGTSS